MIYLTGAPATGKSTLSRNLARQFSNLIVFAYSERLRDHLNSRDATAFDEELIRQHSAQIVTPDDIAEVDRQLAELVRTQRASGPILIDSHAVTKESYGFRVTAFSRQELIALSPDFIFCLYASSDVIQYRIGANAMGRPQVSTFESDMHGSVQCALALQYGLILGKPVYLLDSAASQQDLVQIIAKKTGLSATFSTD